MILELWHRWGLILSCSAGLALICVPSMKALVRLRVSRGLPADLARRRTRAEAGILLGTLPWTWMTLSRIGVHSRTSLVPLVDLNSQAKVGLGFVFYQVVANLVFLLPFGALVPIRWPRLANLWTVTALGVCYSATIETLQYVLDIGRVASLDDVLVNGTGAFVGALLTRRWWHPDEGLAGSHTLTFGSTAR